MADYDCKTKDFFDWTQSHFTSISPKFEIQDLRAHGQGRGLIATEDIRKDEILFEIPRSSILNLETSAIISLDANIKKELLSLNQWKALIICVAYEWFIGEKSKFKSYFDVLPLCKEEFSTLMFWTDEELQYLKPSGALERLGKDAAEEMYAILVGDVIPNKLGLSNLAEFLTLEKFHIVASLIMSYSFDVDHPEEVESNEVDEKEEEEEAEDQNEIQNDIDDISEQDPGEEEGSEQEEGVEDDDEEEEEEEEEEQEPVINDTYLKSMVPLADTLNANTSFFNAKLKYKKETLIMVAEKDITKGEQIFNFYGELPNSEILRKYGYVELPSSKFEFAEISLTSLMAYFEDLFNDNFEFIKAEQADKLIEVAFETIQDSDYLAQTLTDDMESGIVIEKYEIYENGEILPELLLLLLILSSIYKAAKSDEKWFKKLIRGVERKASKDLLSFVDRTILKSYQLLEEKSILTDFTVETLKEIIKRKISEYPTHIIDGSFELPTEYNAFTKKQYADIVLNSEITCLKGVIDGKFPPVNDNGETRFSVIDDEKFLKNLLKRKSEEEEKKASKKSRKN